ncbi:MAG: heme o synthase [Acidimicrobiia bacterium]
MENAPGAVTVLQRVRAYVTLTKPRVVELLLITTVPAIVLAAGRMPSIGLVLGVLAGGTLAAGGANTINSAYEWERDQLMHRTAERPVATGIIRPGAALAFGIILNVIAFVLLWRFANLLAAVLTMAATLFYVFIYTMWLKPRTVQNIVIGGAAGAIPVLVGWAAVENAVHWPAIVMFLIIFQWTPAHFWALAIHHRDDYARASTPMMPVIRGVDPTITQIIVYTALTVAVSLALVPARHLSAIYAISAGILGVMFLAAALRLRGHSDRAMKFFTLSNTYLSLLFVAMLVDVLVHA